MITRSTMRRLGDAACVILLALGVLSCGHTDGYNPDANLSPEVDRVVHPTTFPVGKKTIVFFKIVEPENDPYTLSFLIQTASDFMPYDAGSRAQIAPVTDGAEFSWTPDASDVGVFDVTVYATDDHGHRGSGSVRATVSP